MWPIDPGAIYPPYNYYPPRYPWPSEQSSWAHYQYWDSPGYWGGHTQQNYTTGYWNSPDPNQQANRSNQHRFSPYQSSHLATARYRHSPDTQGVQYQYQDRGRRGRYRTGTGYRERVERATAGTAQYGMVNTKERGNESKEESNDEKRVSEVEEDATVKNEKAKRDVALFDQLRLWEQIVGPETDPGQTSTRVRVLSYNILAQEYITEYPELYVRCEESALNWGVRLKGIKREVVMFMPDIVCMQEVQFSSDTDSSTHFQSDLEPFFTSHGYSHQFKLKTGSKVDGCVIFYKEDKFKLSKVKTVEFKSETISALKCDTVAIICKLIPVATPTTPLVVATTHLLYTVSREHTRVCQAALLLAELDQIAQAPGGGYHPTILMGDFNSCAGHPTLQLLLEGQLDYDGHARLRPVPGHQLVQELGLVYSCQFRQGDGADQSSGSFHHQFGFVSVYPPVPGVTTFQHGWKLVDHIMYSTNAKLKLLTRLSLPTARDMRLLPIIPSHISPSDHLPLLADFEVLKD
eukprot:GFUD01019798.1.p1 GENE.GFUD01019798.1~~GFUD01019798.1.p1  ORF type:complete len:519 (-),score=155.25 GFUD01019798.1:132-1688(-)